MPMHCRSGVPRITPTTRRSTGWAFTLGQDKHYDIAWCGLGYGANPDALTDVTVCLPAGTAQYAVLYYTTADGEQKRTARSTPPRKPRCSR